MNVESHIVVWPVRMYTISQQPAISIGKAGVIWQWLQSDLSFDCHCPLFVLVCQSIEIGSSLFSSCTWRISASLLSSLREDKCRSAWRQCMHMWLTFLRSHHCNVKWFFLENGIAGRLSSVTKVSQDYCKTMRPRLVSRYCDTKARLKIMIYWSQYLHTDTWH